jgi:hypothetical protein
MAAWRQLSGGWQRRRNDVAAAIGGQSAPASAAAQRRFEGNYQHAGENGGSVMWRAISENWRRQSYGGFENQRLAASAAKAA